MVKHLLTIYGVVYVVGVGFIEFGGGGYVGVRICLYLCLRPYKCPKRHLRWRLLKNEIQNIKKLT